MLVLFTGSRLLDEPDLPVIVEGLRSVVGDAHGDHVLVHGDNRGDRARRTVGGDQLAARVATGRGWEVRAFPADWFGPCRDECKHGPRRTFPGETGSTCPAAGPYRNEEMAAMVAAEKGVCLAAYKRGAQNKGTSGCARIAGQAGLTVKRVNA